MAKSFTSDAATLSWVDRGLLAHATTVAPAVFNVMSKFAVSEVICKQQATVYPLSGFSLAKRPRIIAKTGICCPDHSIFIFPSLAKERSATSYLFIIKARGRTKFSQ